MPRKSSNAGLRIEKVPLRPAGREKVFLLPLLHQLCAIFRQFCKSVDFANVPCYVICIPTRYFVLIVLLLPAHETILTH